MNTLKSCCVFFIIAAGCFAAAQTAKPADHHTSSEILDQAVSNLEKEFVSAAEAMPEDKYSFAPSAGEFKGVRSFALQVKHVAAVNYLVGAAILEEKLPVDVGGENGPDSMKSKAEILKFAKDSFTYAHKAMNSLTEKNLTENVKSPFGEGSASRLGLATVLIYHPYDHYGQMVEYLRMNGIVPPASRGR